MENKETKANEAIQIFTANSTDPNLPDFVKSALNRPNGLTKREYFAAMAIQGLIANGRAFITDNIIDAVKIADAEIAQKIQRTGIVELSRKVSGEFVIKADSKVGFISVQGVQVNVAPRFPIYNIFYFLGLLEEMKLDSEKVQISESNDFLTVLFQSFIRSVTSSTRKGLISGYVNREDSLQVLRGRIDFSRQLKKNPGNYFPFEVTFDDFIEEIRDEL
jgi:hypothetical protein